jgi:aldehyde:ferredoxin oxidoreductase
MMELLKEKGLTTFNYKQAHIIAAYKDEVDKLLEEVDGEPMNDHCFWSVSECTGCPAWCYIGYSGSVSYNSKNLAFSVRPLLAH